MHQPHMDSALATAGGRTMHTDGFAPIGKRVNSPGFERALAMTFKTADSRGVKDLRFPGVFGTVRAFETRPLHGQEFTMTRAREGDVVRVWCRGRLADGREFEMSEPGEPLEFIIGHGDLLPELEQAVIGLTPGESRLVVVPKDKGFGPRRDELVQVIDRQLFPAGIEPRIGQTLRLPSEEFKVLSATVTKVTDKEITLDANHPLAGQDALFKITLLEIVEL